MLHHYYNSDKDLIGQRFPGLLVNGSLTDEAYANFLQYRDESKDLGLRGCNLEEIMNEVNKLHQIILNKVVSKENERKESSSKDQMLDQMIRWFSE